MAANKKRSIAFRTELFGISNQLTTADVKNLKFLCTDILPRREVEGIESAFQLFTALEAISELAPDNLGFLEELLKTLNKGHLIRGLKEALAKPDSHLEDDAPASYGPSSHSNPALSMKFKQFLVTIGDELPARDLRNISYFFQSYDVKGLTAQALQKLKEPSELFDLLRQERIISPRDLSKLRHVLDAIGRKDICEMVDDYMKSVTDGERGNSLSFPTMETNPQREVETPQEDDGSLPSSVFSYSDPAEGGKMLNPPPSGLRSNITDSGGAREEEGSTQGRSYEEMVMHVATGGGGIIPREVCGERPVRGVPESSSNQTRIRTRTQMLQLEVNDKTSRIAELETQLAEQSRLEHERAHANAMAKMENVNDHAMAMELATKNNEIEGLRQEIVKLRKDLCSDESDMYPMNACPPHGKAIVIVNDKFTPNPAEADLELRNRPGAEEDMRLFTETFKSLGYVVERHYNKSAMDMYHIIDSAAYENHAEYDSFVCCVSTHGNENVMYGSDSVEVKRLEWLQPLKVAPSLHGKPKMCFFQACRTKADDTSAGVNQQYPIYQPDAPDKDADIFIANASTAHNASYRSSVTGSWFVMALHHVFTQHSHHLTLDEMMHKVNSVVCDARGTIREGGQQEARQCAESTSSFRKGLRFKFMTLTSIPNEH